ncbi:hypothetical protein TNCT_301401, partial [Trichonephila clavata]
SANNLDKFSAPFLVFSAMLGLIGFLLLSISASDIHEADKMAKRINSELCKEEWLYHKRKCISEWIPLPFTDSERAFKLSRWNLFFFTRNFILSAFGNLLTYTLLLLQLDLSLSQMELT